VVAPATHDGVDLFYQLLEHFPLMLIHNLRVAGN
jgi:hypothetical protein